MSELQNSSLATLDPERADDVIVALDEVAQLYMSKVRKISRKILSIGRNPDIVQENNAEHQWSAVIATLTLWHNRDALGIGFAPDFDITKSVESQAIHDVGESFSETGDVDAMNDDPQTQTAKRENEIDAFDRLARTSKYLGWIGVSGRAAEEKATPETMFNSDVEKHLAIRVIRLYAPHRWLGINGEITTREKHDRIMGQKLLTPFGKTLYVAQRRDFDREEQRRRERRLQPLFPPTENYGHVMRESYLHQHYMGYKIWRPHKLTVDWDYQKDS